MISITVNGQALTAPEIPTSMTLLDFLREHGLTGAKEGCAEGECGACSVLVARPGQDTPTEWVAVNSCLIPAAAVDRQEVVTAEGLGTPEVLHPVQYLMASIGGSQCGYCTPGFVCSMAAEYYRGARNRHTTSAPGDAARTSDRAGDDRMTGQNGFDIHALSGNLCRCTGYRPIQDAAFALGWPEDDDWLARRRSAPAPTPTATDISDGDSRFVRATTLDAALRLLHDNRDVTIVAGCTDWGVQVNIRGERATLTLAVDQVPEMRELRQTSDYIEIGSALTLTEIERLLRGRIPLLACLWPQFASRLIRNRATLGGNIGTGSPIGDALPALLALEATVCLVGHDGERDVPIADYFTGYRTSVRATDELIRAIRVPLPLASTATFYKIAKRRFDDISSVAVAIALEIRDGIVEKARIGLGGVADRPIRALRTESLLTGSPWTTDSVDAASQVMCHEAAPLSDHRASAAYRTEMLTQSLHRLYAEMMEGELV